MLERAKKIIQNFLWFIMKQELDLPTGSGSDHNVPAPAVSGSATLLATISKLCLTLNFLKVHIFEPDTTIIMQLWVGCPNFAFKKVSLQSET